MAELTLHTEARVGPSTTFTFRDTFSEMCHPGPHQWDTSKSKTDVLVLSVHPRAECPMHVNCP